MYDAGADAFKNQEVILHSFGTFTQLAIIDGNTLRAPDDQPDDKADGFVLAVCGRLKLRSGRITMGEPCVLIPGRGQEPLDRRVGAFQAEESDWPPVGWTPCKN
jgi:hypothetical protein